MLVVDLMHECELGTWKALFTHLIRLLYALPEGIRLVATLDERYTEFNIDYHHTLTSFILLDPMLDFAKSRHTAAVRFANLQTILLR